MGQEESRCLEVGRWRWRSAGLRDNRASAHLRPSLDLSLPLQRCFQMLKLMLHLLEEEEEFYMTPEKVLILHRVKTRVTGKETRRSWI